jgi:hypothetical protein
MIQRICSSLSEVIRFHLRQIAVFRFIGFAIAVAALLVFSALTCSAQEGGIARAPAATAEAPRWACSVTGSYYSFRDQDDFVLAVATAEKGPLHLEARYNYEAQDSGSLFAGWKFPGGETLTYELTPILGGVFGQKEGIAPGFEAAVAYGVADFYIEAEYVYDLEIRKDSFTYAWIELGFTPREWLRSGFVGQRTMVYQSERDTQRGVFAQLMYRKMTLGLYVFNPDDSGNRFSVFSLGAEF